MNSNRTLILSTTDALNRFIDSLPIDDTDWDDIAEDESGYEPKSDGDNQDLAVENNCSSRASEPCETDFDDEEYRDNRRVRRLKARAERLVDLANHHEGMENAASRSQIYNQIRRVMYHLSVAMDLQSARYARRHHLPDFAGVPATFGEYTGPDGRIAYMWITQDFSGFQSHDTRHMSNLVRPNLA